MRYSFLKTFFFLIVVAIVISLFDRYFLNHKLTQVGPVIIEKPASYIFSKLESVNFFTKHVLNFMNITKESDDLKKENLNLLSQMADYEDIQSENSFLRKSLNVAPRFKGDIVYADIFISQLGPGGYDTLITRGLKDGVTENAIVITEERVLVGKIEKAYDSFSRVLAVSDPEFKVTVKVLGTDTSGIAKGALEKGMILDFITQKDVIKEGDNIVTAGVDFFPPSLVVGAVDYVEINENDLFKKVRIKPAVKDVKLSRVLIIKNNTE